MLNQVGYWVLVALGFGFLVFVHEFGHFLCARLVRIRVIQFAFGLGPRLFGKKIGATDYCVCAVPFGGFVKMAGGEGEEKSTGAPDEFPSKKPWQRALVVVGGPVMSIVIAIPLLFITLSLGFERPSARINHILPGSGAWYSDLRRGDVITGLRWRDETAWQDIRIWRDLRVNTLLKERVGAISIRAERDGREFVADVTTGEGGIIGFEPDKVGSELGYTSAVVGVVPRGSSGGKAGLVPGARILSLGGARVHVWRDIERAVQLNPGKALEISYALPGGGLRTGTLQVPSQKSRWLGIFGTFTNRIGFVRPGFPAATAGLRVGDAITSVAGRPVQNWSELEQAILDLAHVEATGEFPITFRRGGQDTTVKVRYNRGDEIGDVLGIGAEPFPLVTGFAPGSNAPAEGVKVGAKLTRLVKLDLDKDDRVRHLKDMRGLEWDPRERAMRRLEPLTLAYEQNGTQAEAHIQPVDGEVGVVDFSPRLDYCRVVPPGRPIQALAQAVREAQRWTYIGWRALGMLVTGHLPFGELSGPLMIFAASHYQVEQGYLNFIEFIAMITISLGVANLMPLPVLDGGHLVFLLVEKIRGKPVPESVMVRILYVGWAFLIALLLAVTWNDVSRLFGL